jgi:hypothetical protein
LAVRGYLIATTEAEMLEVLRDCSIREHFVSGDRLVIDNPLIERKVALLLLKEGIIFVRVRSCHHHVYDTQNNHVET